MSSEAITYSERFEYHNDSENSHKFWEYEYNGYPAFSLTTRWGRIGTKGSTKTLPGLVHSSEVDVRVGTKLNKGYKRVPMEPDPSLGNQAKPWPGLDTSLKPTGQERDPKLNLIGRMESLLADKDFESVPKGYTLVQCYEWRMYGFREYKQTVEIARIPYSAFGGSKESLNKLIEGVDGLVVPWEEAKRMMTLLNGTPITSGDPGSYGGSFRSLKWDYFRGVEVDLEVAVG